MLLLFFYRTLCWCIYLFLYLIFFKKQRLNLLLFLSTSTPEHWKTFFYAFYFYWNVTFQRCSVSVYVLWMVIVWNVIVLQLCCTPDIIKRGDKKNKKKCHKKKALPMETIMWSWTSLGLRSLTSFLRLLCVLNALQPMLLWAARHLLLSKNPKIK